MPCVFLYLLNENLALCKIATLFSFRASVSHWAYIALLNLRVYRTQSLFAALGSRGLGSYRPVMSRDLVSVYYHHDDVLSPWLPKSVLCYCILNLHSCKDSNDLCYLSEFGY